MKWTTLSSTSSKWQMTQLVVVQYKRVRSSFEITSCLGHCFFCESSLVFNRIQSKNWEVLSGPLWNVYKLVFVILSTNKAPNEHGIWSSSLVVPAFTCDLLGTKSFCIGLYCKRRHCRVEMVQKTYCTTRWRYFNDNSVMFTAKWYVLSQSSFRWKSIKTALAKLFPISAFVIVSSHESIEICDETVVK